MTLAAREVATAEAWVAGVSGKPEGIELRSPGSAVDTAVMDGCRAIVAGSLHGLGQADGDARALVAAYLEEGERVLERVKGFFAFALWDGREERLLLARDPLGIHPLFYTEAEHLLISSSIDALLASPGVSRSVNRAALADYLRHQWPDPGETFFRAVRRLPPGHALRATGSERMVFRYWNPPLPSRDIEWIKEEELGRFDDLLDTAVRRALAQGLPAIYLSGGLDSVSVAAVATDVARTDGLIEPLALSLVFPEPYSEETTQRSVAGQLGLQHLVASLQEALGNLGLVEAAVRASSKLPGPIQNPWLPAYAWLAEEARRRGRATILTGSGGDEWLTVSPLYAADLLRRLDIGGLVRLGQSHARSYEVSRAALVRNLLWNFGARPILTDHRRAIARKVAPGALRARRLRRLRSALRAQDWLAPDPALRAELAARDEEVVRLLEEEDELIPAAGPRMYFRECRQAIAHPVVSLEAEEVFDYARRAGVRIVHPYWDTELVEFLLATPPRLLNHKGRAKGLIREMLALRFPGVGFERQRKAVIPTFFATTVARDGPRIWSELGGPQALAEAGIVDLAALRRRDGRGPAGRRTVARLWEILTVEAWLRGRMG
jgi:asparagine synthase (glutamine-hydrolysing)